MLFNQTHLFQTHLCRIFVIATLSIGVVATVACEGEPNDGDTSQSSSDQRPSCDQGPSFETPDEPMANSASHSGDIETPDIFVEGYDECDMVRAYFPKDILEQILPKGLSIPDDEVMAEHYPDTELKDDVHPFLMEFCHGSDIHDVYTKLDFPEQEELLFMFPVLYTNDSGESFLCSYVPVLYLDSVKGTVGGLFFGLRKEFHPNMEHGATDTKRWWSIDGIIEGSFVNDGDQELEALPGFIEETFANPTITLSYPTPVAQLYVYETHVFPSYVTAANERFTWNFKKATVEQSDDTWSIYTEFDFAMSLAKPARKYFWKN